jgi:hypothetical protein
VTSSNAQWDEVRVEAGLAESVNLFEIENTLLTRCLIRSFELPGPDPEQPISAEASHLLETIPNADLLVAYRNFRLGPNGHIGESSIQSQSTQPTIIREEQANCFYGRKHGDGIDEIMQEHTSIFDYDTSIDRTDCTFDSVTPEYSIHTDLIPKNIYSHTRA